MTTRRFLVDCVGPVKWMRDTDLRDFSVDLDRQVNDAMQRYRELCEQRTAAWKQWQKLLDLQAEVTVELMRRDGGVR